MKKTRKSGGGRKPLPYKTKTVRVPVPVLDDVLRIIQEFKK